MHEAEGGERQSLDHDLHAHVRHIPTGVAEDIVDEELQIRVDGVVTVELGVQVASEHLDVARLVHHLRRRVVLRIDPRGGDHDLAGAQQGALLAVEELAHPPVEGLHLELQPFLVAPVLDRGPFDVGHALLKEVDRAGHLSRDLLDVNVDGPIEVGGTVPLRRLRLLVQLGEALSGTAVVPGEDGVTPCGSRVEVGAEIPGIISDDRLDVVDVFAAQELVGRRFTHRANISRGREACSCRHQ